jgi:hypothetical protein
MYVMAMNIRLTPDQEDFVLNNHKTIKDLSVLTQKCFGNESLDGRSIEGKLVRAFLAKNNLKYNTSNSNYSLLKLTARICPKKYNKDS